MSALSTVASFAVSIAISSVVAVAQEPVAQKPVGAIPIDSITPEDSARVDSVLQRHRDTRCWRARPMPECRMVFLTDIGLEFPLYATPTTSRKPYQSKSFPPRLNWSIGLMRNGDRHSHGIALSVTSENTSQMPHLVEYRYRRWLSRNSAVDAGFGWKRNSIHHSAGELPSDGMTFFAGFTPSRWFGATIRYDHINALGRPHRGIMLGAQSTRVSEYTFQLMAIALRDWLLGLIGFEWESEPESPPSSSMTQFVPVATKRSTALRH